MGPPFYDSKSILDLNYFITKLLTCVRLIIIKNKLFIKALHVITNNNYNPADEVEMINLHLFSALIR